MASREKEVVADEKRKRTAPRTRVGIDFDPKPSSLSSQEDVSDYLMKHRGPLPSTIAMELYSAKMNMKVEPPARDVYFHPLILAFGFSLSLTPICSKCVGILSSSSHSVDFGCIADSLDF